jgi:UDP-N-acetylmuramate dehydrogenase
MADALPERTRDKPANLGRSASAAGGLRSDIAQALTQIPAVSLRQVQAARYTTMAVGGSISLVELQSTEAAAEAIKLLAAEGEPYCVLGAGSNLLIQDAGVHAWVLKLGVPFRYQIAGQQGNFSVGAGASLMSLSRELSAKGFSGLEFAGGIPASIGGAVVMNAGAHGSEIAQVLQSVKVIDASGLPQELSVQELAYSYRHSNISSQMLVLEATLRLQPGDPQRCAALRAHYLAERKARQPLQLPSAGSVFRNPSPQQTAGMLLEQAGLKGHSVGGAQYSELHANWIVNPKRQASFQDVQGLIALGQSRVREQCGLELKPELVVWE